MPHSEAAKHDHKIETAGHLATARVPLARATDTAAHVRQIIRDTAFETIELIIATDDAGHYVGVVQPSQLYRAEDAAPLQSLITRDWPTIAPEIDQEQAVLLAMKTAAIALPVVDVSQKPIGILTPKTLFEVLSSEHREDTNRLVGVLRERDGARHALEDPPLRQFGRRMPWLLVGLALSSGATALMASYEQTLQKNVVIAFFIPALVYLTDAIGTQTEAITVRGLSIRHRPLASILLNELLTGALIGLALAVLAVIATAIAFGNVFIGIGVGLSLLAAGTMACGIGLVLPWVLSKAGIDPAFGAGPVATILQDVLTIAIYLVIMTHVMGLVP